MVDEAMEEFSDELELLEDSSYCCKTKEICCLASSSDSKSSGVASLAVAAKKCGEH